MPATTRTLAKKSGFFKSKKSKIFIIIFVLIFVAVGAFVIYKSFASSGGGGSAHSCWVKTDTTLWCWGANNTGQLGLGDQNRRLKPTVVMTGVKKVALGNSHTCALKTSGEVWCWGDDTYGQVGSSSVSLYTTKPTLVYFSGSANVGVLDITAGGNSSCAVIGSRYLHCWGQNNTGQLASAPGDTNDKYSPTPTPKLGGNVLSATLGDYHGCANKTDGSIFCWGDNTQGQLGIGSNTSKPGDPTQLFFNTKGLLAAGERHTCAIASDTAYLYCWGLNDNGQLGIGNNTNQNKPVKVNNISVVGSLSAGYRSTCAGKIGGGMWCWGGNAFGQLGINSTTNSNTPKPLFWTALDSISMGNRHTCASRTDRSLWCWGDNSDGQLGIGSTTSTKMPTQLYFNTFQ